MADEKESEQPKATGWVTICRSGRSLDGRNITAKMLRDCEETYNPKAFTAMMWPYHVSSPFYRYDATNFGKVLALQTTEKDGATHLQARLQPNKFALAANRARQKIFSSVEFGENYMGTGKAWLQALALTDVPASTWTTELMFSQQAHSSIYGQPEMFSLDAEINHEEPLMNQQQYDTLLGAIHNKGVQLNDLEARVNQFSQMLNKASTQPQQFAAQPQPAYALPQQFAVQPQPAYAQPQQFAVQPQPAYAQPQPFAAQPQPAYAQPQQFAAQPQPVYAQPQQFAAQPQPAYAQPQQFAVQPQPAYVQPQPCFANPQQFATQMQTACAQPQQYSVQPQPTDALSNTQFQHLLTAMTGISAGVNGMEQKFAQLMQDTTQTPSLNPAGGNQVTIV
ncbi:GPO family capsid scaffolding protein [Salmonella enterica]|nr:GPO family capsid scaffolding protein [Salmonella enterica]EJJ4290078.1 GPO family capsid scaffolding protein [Salmonella enterica]EJJ4530979.1 GPO family capsid scaffolding protein [Salmonella enterica]